jgi:hypothetical protein
MIRIVIIVFFCYSEKRINFKGNCPVYSNASWLRRGGAGPCADAVISHVIGLFDLVELRIFEIDSSFQLQVKQYPQVIFILHGQLYYNKLMT